MKTVGTKAQPSWRSSLTCSHWEKRQMSLSWWSPKDYYFVESWSSNAYPFTLPSDEMGDPCHKRRWVPRTNVCATVGSGAEPDAFSWNTILFPQKSNCGYSHAGFWQTSFQRKQSQPVTAGGNNWQNLLRGGGINLSRKHKYFLKQGLWAGSMNKSNHHVKFVT